ncbi:hypothetical protein OBK01_02710 [Empedobacter falsenii]
MKKKEVLDNIEKCFKYLGYAFDQLNFSFSENNNLLKFHDDFSNFGEYKNEADDFLKFKIYLNYCFNSNIFLILHSISNDKNSHYSLIKLINYLENHKKHIENNDIYLNIDLANIKVEISNQPNFIKDLRDNIYGHMTFKIDKEHIIYLDQLDNYYFKLLNIYKKLRKNYYINDDWDVSNNATKMDYFDLLFKKREEILLKTKNAQ